MAAVSINTGPVSADDKARDVPPEKWFFLTLARRHFVRVGLPYDCRSLLTFVREADEHGIWQKDGYESLDDYIRRGLGIDPAVVAWAAEGLKKFGLEVPAPWGIPQHEVTPMSTVNRIRTDNHPEPNPYAPKGTVGWALSIAQKIKSFIDDQAKSARHLEDYIQVFQKEKGYALLKDEFGQPFASFEAWCAHPKPRGLGYDISRHMENALSRDAEKTARFIFDRYGPDYARELSEQLRELDL